jgi:predicted CXXCH cytochrome family protein
MTFGLSLLRRFSLFQWSALLLILSPLSLTAANGYLGSDVCAGCHKEIARTQFQTNMARTWQGISTQQLPPNYLEKHAEGPPPVIEYTARRSGDKAQYTVQMPGQPALEFPVESIIGGKRHGVTFLYRVPTLDGLPLPRTPLVEGRYIHSTLEHGLALELGFPEDKPTNYETAFGRVLTPSLEKRCLGCHVAPRTLGTRVETGVACENCHGPGQPHLAALAAHSKAQRAPSRAAEGMQEPSIQAASACPSCASSSQDLGILNPDKLPPAERMRPCSQCHAGSGFVEDPMADNLLISDQVTALQNSECWRQSGAEITCTNCHNPHQDAPRSVIVARSEQTCARCHSASVTKHAGLCPVNRVSGCVGCHMPNLIHGAFHLASHWIGVHPEQKISALEHNPAWRTTITPNHMYLRMIVLEDAAKASALHQQLLAGASFFELARANSMDRATAINGGFMGDLQASQFDPAWSAAALKLQPGELCDVVPANGKYVILQRMPRNFREQAEAKVDDSVNLRKAGKQQESVAELFDALRIYPHFLRALTYLGINYAQTGNPQVAAGVLSIATRLYPRDQGAHFNLGVAYGAMGNENEIAEYKRTLEIDSDYVPAYLNWGGALFAKGQYDEAIQMYRQAININPLSASLHYSLSVALARINHKQEAEAEMKLAAKIDPKYAAH